MRFCVVFGNRGYCLHSCKFFTRMDAVKFALQRFKFGYDYIRIDAPKF